MNTIVLLSPTDFQINHKKAHVLLRLSFVYGRPSMNEKINSLSLVRSHVVRQPRSVPEKASTSLRAGLAGIGLVGRHILLVSRPSSFLNFLSVGCLIVVNTAFRCLTLFVSVSDKSLSHLVVSFRRFLYLFFGLLICLRPVTCSA